MPKKLTIAVVGIGLIGGSLLKTLRTQNFHLIGISRSESTIKKAEKLNIADEYSTDLSLLSKADIVFICTPISKIISMIDQIKNIISPDCIVTDVGSLKGFVLDYVNNSQVKVNYIGGHPMAGTEYQGVDYAVDNLFIGAKWILTPSRFADQTSVDKLSDILKITGADIIFAEPEAHDKAVALISHFPLLLSQALFTLVNNYPDNSIKTLALRLASSGFRDTTRLAATNPELAKDMLLDNRHNVQDVAKHLQIVLNSMIYDLNCNENSFIDHIKDISSDRRKLYSSDGKNIY